MAPLCLGVFPTLAAEVNDIVRVLSIITTRPAKFDSLGDNFDGDHGGGCYIIHGVAKGGLMELVLMPVPRVPTIRENTPAAHDAQLPT